MKGLSLVPSLHGLGLENNISEGPHLSLFLRICYDMFVINHFSHVVYEIWPGMVLDRKADFGECRQLVNVLCINKQKLAI